MLKKNQHNKLESSGLSQAIVWWFLIAQVFFLSEQWLQTDAAIMWAGKGQNWHWFNPMQKLKNAIEYEPFIK